MDDEVDALLVNFRAATATDVDDPTRRAIWAALRQRTAPRRRADVVVWAGVLAIAAAILLVWSLVDRTDLERLGQAPPADQAVDRTPARDSDGTIATRAAEAPRTIAAPAIPEPPTAGTATPVVAPAPIQRPSAPRTIAPAPTTDDPLARESALIVRAREAALRGDRASAGAALDEHVRAFPNGTLARERWVLTIELACAAGDVAAARRDAAAFFAAYPGSRGAATLRERPCDPVTKPPAGGQLSEEPR